MPPPDDKVAPEIRMPMKLPAVLSKELAESEIAPLAVVMLDPEVSEMLRVVVKPIEPETTGGNVAGRCREVDRTR